MRWMGFLVGLTLASVAWAQGGDPMFTAGSTNVLSAACGGKVLAASSQMLDGNGKVVPQWQASNLIDGKYVTGTYRPEDSHGWSSNVVPKTTDPAWVLFAFDGEKTHLISRIVLDPTTIDPPIIGRAAKDFQLYVSNTTKDGPWAMVKSGTLLNKSIRQTFDFLPVEARYLRLVISSNWGSDRFVELGEVEVYDAVAGDDTLDQLIVRLENMLRDLKRYRDSVKNGRPLYPELGAPAAATAAPVTPAPAATTQPAK